MLKNEIFLSAKFIHPFILWATYPKAGWTGHRVDKYTQLQRGAVNISSPPDVHIIRIREETGDPGMDVNVDRG